MVNMPAPKGQLTANRPLADLTWMRVGGPADYFFLPASSRAASPSSRCLSTRAAPEGDPAPNWRLRSEARRSRSLSPLSAALVLSTCIAAVAV